VTLAAGAALGIVFGLLAGACAFVIAYSELKRNWSFMGNPVHRALRTAAVTFLIFFIATMLLPQLFLAIGP
jgi:hypothetical protein